MFTMNKEHYVIFSIDFANDSLTLARFQQWLWDKKIGHKRLSGAYKGVTEPSFIVNSTDWVTVLKSGYVDFQESMLELGPELHNGRRKALLVFLGSDKKFVGMPVDLGELGEVSKEEALSHDSWTYFRGDIDKYFVTKLDWNSDAIDSAMLAELAMQNVMAANSNFKGAH